jgi:hypothetical protein
VISKRIYIPCIAGYLNKPVYYPKLDSMISFTNCSVKDGTTPIEALNCLENIPVFYLKKRGFLIFKAGNKENIKEVLDRIRPEYISETFFLMVLSAVKILRQ